MKASIKMFGGVGIFMLVMTIIYAVWTNAFINPTTVSTGIEPIGVVAMLLSALLCFMIAWYLHYTGKHTPFGPEDDPAGEIADAEGDYGFFTPYSWWPLWLGLSAAIIFAGLAVGWWLVAIGAFVGPFALVGWAFEHFKGEHAN